MKAFTTSTPSFLPMAQEAGRRIIQYGGVSSVDYVLCESKTDCHRRKLESLLSYREPIWFFDADWMMIRNLCLPFPVGNLVLAAPCDNQQERYSGTSVLWQSAFCSCLLGLDMGNEEVRKFVESAIQIQNKDYRSDEKALNIALFENPRLMLGRLSQFWNWCGPAGPLTVAIHAAERPNKMEWLCSQMK